jgi:hypothetical protein
MIKQELSAAHQAPVEILDHLSGLGRIGGGTLVE